MCAVHAVELKARVPCGKARALQWSLRLNACALRQVQQASVLRANVDVRRV